MSAARPAVSVVVPVYDTEAELPRCLDSLLAQTLDGLEIVVVNDGSTDASQEVIDSYVARHPGAFRTVMKENGGLADARNAGLAIATGEFVGFVDSDDYVDERMFERLHRRAVETGADIVVCDYLGIDAQTGARHRFREGATDGFGRSIREDPGLLLRVGASACNKLFRRSLFSADLLFPARLDFEDLATTYRLFARAARIEKVDDVLYYYVLHRAGSISRDWRRFIQLPQALDVLDDWYVREGLFDAFRHELEYLNLLHLITGRFPDLLAYGPREVTGAYVDAACDHLDKAFDGWRGGRAARELCPNPLLRLIVTTRPLLKTVAARSPRVVLGVARRLGLFGATPVTRPSHRIAYLSLQAVVDGQDTWAAVTEVVSGWEALGWTVDRYFPEYAGGAPGALARLAEMRRVQRRLARRIGGYDAVYVRAHPLAWPTSRRAARAGVPVVQECNGPYEDLFIAWPRTRIARPVFEQLQRSQYRSAAAIVSVAEGLTRWLQREAPGVRVVTNGNGANTDVFGPEAPRRPGLPERYAVFFGQFPAWQGIGTLLSAVLSEGWPASLPVVFAGDGAMRSAVEEAAAAAPERVVYVGRLPYREVAGVVAHAAMSFVPMAAPERETMFSPLKLYESMACGVPVVASNVIGISEVVNEANCGLLVPAEDAVALANAARRLLADPEEARAMGRRGRASAVERYSWRARSRQRLEVVEQEIGRTTGSG